MLKYKMRGRRYRSIFSFYGGKSRIAYLYPAPAHGTIIEPFCGGASYSALYHDKQVMLYDADPVTASIWEFLLADGAWAVCQMYIPETVKIGTLVSDLLPDTAPEGLLRLLQAEANAGTQGARGVHNQVTKFGASGWHRILPKMEYWLPKIRHWKFRKMQYGDIQNEEATWFIDPPYNNPAGKRYRTQVGDYNSLSRWCQRRWGQVIVCENSGAGWLPFVPLVARRGVISSYQKSRSMEAVYLKGGAYDQAV